MFGWICIACDYNVDGSTWDGDEGSRFECRRSAGASRPPAARVYEHPKAPRSFVRFWSITVT